MSFCNLTETDPKAPLSCGAGRCVATIGGATNQSDPVGICHCPFLSDPAYNCAKSFFYTYQEWALVYSSVRKLVVKSHGSSSPLSNSSLHHADSSQPPTSPTFPFFPTFLSHNASFSGLPVFLPLFFIYFLLVLAEVIGDCVLRKERANLKQPLFLSKLVLLCAILARFLFFGFFIANYYIGQTVVFAPEAGDIVNIVGLMAGLAAYSLVVATWTEVIERGRTLDEKGYFQNLRKGLLYSALAVTIAEVILVLVGIPLVQYNNWFKSAINGSLALYGLTLIGLSAYALFRSKGLWKFKRGSRTALRVRRRSQILAITAAVAFAYIALAIGSIVLGQSPWNYYALQATYKVIELGLFSLFLAFLQNYTYNRGCFGGYCVRPDTAPGSSPPRTPRLSEMGSSRIPETPRPPPTARASDAGTAEIGEDAESSHSAQP